jgi:hypothetical protein
VIPRPGFAFFLLGILLLVAVVLGIFSFIWWGWAAVAMYVFSVLALVGCGFAVPQMRADGASATAIGAVITLTVLGVASAVLGSSGHSFGIAYEPRVILLLGSWALWVAAGITALTARGGAR